MPARRHLVARPAMMAGGMPTAMGMPRPAMLPAVATPTAHALPMAWATAVSPGPGMAPLGALGMEPAGLGAGRPAEGGPQPARLKLAQRPVRLRPAAAERLGPRASGRTAR